MKYKFMPLSGPVLALILTGSAQALWALAGAWLWQMQAMFLVEDRTMESVVIQTDGAPLLVRETYRSNRYVGQREVLTLEGKPVERESTVYGAQFAAPSAPPKPFERVDWLHRLQAYGVRAQPPEFWYFLHDGTRNGLGYFEGFVAETSRHLGYIGRSGLRADRPPREDQFSATLESVTARAYQTWPLGYEPWDQFRYQHGKRDRTTFVVATDQVWEVNLNTRQVRVIWKGRNAIDIQPLRLLQTKVRDVIEDEGSQHLAVRTQDKLEVLTDNMEIAYSAALPEAVRSELFQAYELSRGGLLLLVHNRDRYEPRATLHWIGEEPGQDKSRTVVLAGGEKRTPPMLYWAGLGFLLPSPLFLAGGIGVKALDDTGTSAAPTYGAALSQEVAAAWPTLVAVSLVASALALRARARQRAFGLDGGTVWAIFVFLFGPVGWAGYFWHRRWAVRAACPLCGTLVPLDRTACLACGREFPGPKALGTELRA